MKLLLLLLLIGIGAFPLAAEEFSVPEMDMQIELGYGWVQRLNPGRHSAFEAAHNNESLIICGKDLGHDFYSSSLEDRQYQIDLKSQLIGSTGQGELGLIQGDEQTTIGNVPAYLIWGEIVRADTGDKAYFCVYYLALNKREYSILLQGNDSTYLSYRRIAGSCTFNHPDEAYSSARGPVKNKWEEFGQRLGHLLVARLVVAIIGAILALAIGGGLWIYWLAFRRGSSR